MSSDDPSGDGPTVPPSNTAGPAARPGRGAADGTDRARRESGPRREVNEMVVLHGGDQRIEGWALNMSRGGMRAILDETVPVGREYELSLGQGAPRRPVRVVWARKEKGGAIVGVAFLDVTDGSIPPPPSRPPTNPPPIQGTGG